MTYHTLTTIRQSSKNHAKVKERITLVTERLRIIEKQQYAEDKQLKEYLENETAKAVSALSKYLKSPDAIEQFTSWTLDHVPNTEGSWEMTLDGIQKALMKRLQDVIAAWEENNHVFSDARTSLFQYLQQRLNHAEGQPQNLESSDIDEDAASPSSDPLTSENLSLTEKVVIGATSPIWVPVGLAVLLVSAPVISTMAAKEKLADWRKTREYEKDKCGFMANASREYLSEVADEQDLKSLVVEEFKAEKLLYQQLKDEKRLQKELEDVYKPLYKRSVHLIEKFASFGIDEIGTMDISCDDLEWKEDRSSLLGTGAFASVYRGTLKPQEEEQPVHVALKVWHKALNDCSTSRFLSEIDTLR